MVGGKRAMPSKVKHITGLAGRAFSQGSIERWNGTVKSIIGRLWTARKDKRWVADLPQLVYRFGAKTQDLRVGLVGVLR